MEKKLPLKARSGKKSPFEKKKPRTLLTGRATSDLNRSMREVNKLIFVQDFERASKVLRQLSNRHPADYEVQFRRIEVACRTEELTDVYREYQERAMQTPQVMALSLAATMAEIRLLEMNASEGREPDELINPSLQLGSRGDVTGLSLDTERSGLGTRLRLPILPQGVGGARSSVFLARSFRVVRNPLVADDAVPADMPHLPESYADANQADSPLFFQDNSIQAVLAPCVQHALEMRDLHPGNYATWFVLGCAFEFAGQLAQAIEAWTRALELNPKSVAVLATMAELQQIGVIPTEDQDYAESFEAIDKYLVHGTFDTHTELYKEFLERKEYNLAIAALRSLGDWIQRQRGEVPPEIEVMCLLGAMKAYLLEGNSAAAEACKREAENLAIAVKKSPKSAAQVAFIGQLCEEYGLASLARVCFYSILISKEASTDLVVKTSAHCVTAHVSLSLKECLKTAYRNHQGHAEIRFCQLLCELALANVQVRSYMERKNKIRELISANDSAGALQLMNESLHETTEDAEVHYYLGELLSKLGSLERAKHHFSVMYDLDFLNSDSVVRYVNFLLKSREYFLAQDIARKAIDIPSVTVAQRAELHWARATALFAENENEDARQESDKALRIEPWNMTYIYLALKLQTPQRSDTNPLPHEGLVEDSEHLFGSKKKVMSDELLKRWLERGRGALAQGYMDYAYLLARCAFASKHTNDVVVDFFALAAAAYQSRIGAQHLLMLTQQKNNTTTFAELACCIARVYSYSGEWPLVDEWIDIAVKSGVEEKHTRSKLFELEALKLVMMGVHFKRAQNLLEAALDIYDSNQKVSADTGVLHGYLLLAQGDIKGGMEKMQSHIGESNSIQSLYFLVKGLERAGQLTGAEQEKIARLFLMTPTNVLEQKLIEEIYCTVGLHKSGRTVNLAS